MDPVAAKVASYLPFIFPFFFASIWLIAATLLGRLSGWYRLMRLFPDRSEQPIEQIRGISGSMGAGVNMNGVLTLSVCPSGLRLHIMYMFGPFCRDFLVPWESISVTQKKTFFWSRSRLQFGQPAIGSLTISMSVAGRLAQAAAGRWSIAETVPLEKTSTTVLKLAAQAAFVSIFVALFLNLIPVLFISVKDRPPILVAVGMPAVIFIAHLLVGLWQQRRR